MYWLQKPGKYVQCLKTQLINHLNNLYTLVACENPPRPIEGSALHIEMSGYLPARGDFTVEYDNYAEMSLKDISFTDTSDQLYTGNSSLLHLINVCTCIKLLT